MPLYLQPKTTLTADVTGSGASTIPTSIAPHVVSYEKMQNATSGDRILGTVGTGASPPWGEVPFTQAARDLVDDANFDAMRTTLGVQPGADVQTFDTDLSAIANLSTTGVMVRTGAGTAATRSLTQPAEGITISNNDGVAGNPTFALANDLAALEGLGSTGFAARTASNTWAQRTITAGTSINITNGDGVSGNPVINAVNNYIQSASGEVVADQTTTSSNLVDLPGASVTISTSAGTKVKIEVSFSMSNASALGSLNRIALVIDGTPVPRKNSAFSSPLLSNFVQGGSITHIATGLSAGNHTFKLQWSNTTGTTQCRPVTGAPNTEHASITVMEIR